MSTAGIQRLRQKFISIAMVSFFLVMVITGVLVNVSYFAAAQDQMHEILDILVENEGILVNDSKDSDANSDTDSEFINEYRTGLRYFSVIYDSEGEVQEINLNHTFVLDEKRAESLANRAVHRFLDSGTINGYYFRVYTYEDGRTIAAFVNGTAQVEIRHQVIRYTTLICGAGLFLTFLIVWKISKYVIQPEIDNAKRQKEFITNASHELKTPLAVIRANTEVIEMTAGESEWTESTLKQVEHMNGLIQNLVMIAKAEEMEDRSGLTEINLSEVVRKSTDPYKALAIQEKKEFTIEIEDDINIVAEESKMLQLTSILVDNAFKYCDPEGKVRVNLSILKKGKKAVLTVSNSYAEGANTDVTKFFERFYREDTSHTNQKGYGIGLSMAESIVRLYRGQIRAEWKDGVISFICTLQ